MTRSGEYSLAEFQTKETSESGRFFGRKAAICSDEEEAQHVLRVVGRARLLSCVPLIRRDTEGIEQVDVDASGSKSFKDRRNSLNPNERALLEIFRSGAASTPTRRQHREVQAQGVCLCCGHSCKPSMRHFVVECPHFQQERRRAEEAHNMKPEIWEELSRVTTESAWITFQAHPQKSRRGVFQAAVCQLAICILSDDSLKKANPGRSMTADSRLSSQGQRFGLKFSQSCGASRLNPQFGCVCSTSSHSEEPGTVWLVLGFFDSAREHFHVLHHEDD